MTWMWKLKLLRQPEMMPVVHRSQGEGVCKDGRSALVNGIRMFLPVRRVPLLSVVHEGVP